MQKVKPSFKNARELLKKIDNLPAGPAFRCEQFVIEGDLLDSEGNPMTEETEMWSRDIIDCVRELLSNASFRNETSYAPKRVFRVDENKQKIREFSEVCTADWNWEKQVALSSSCCPSSLSPSNERFILGQASRRSHYCFNPRLFRQNCSLQLQWR